MIYKYIYTHSLVVLNNLTNVACFFENQLYFSSVCLQMVTSNVLRFCAKYPIKTRTDLSMLVKQLEFGDML